MTASADDLGDYMSDLSEKAWCAGWMQDLEFSLWRAVVEGPFDYGHLRLTAAHISRLRELAEACGGWIVYREDEEFVSMADWLALYAAHKHTA